MRSRVIASLLSCALILSPLRLSADETAEPAASDAAAADRATAEDAWRKELNEAKASQSRKKITGIVAGLAGAGLAIAGNLRAGTAEDVEGCERDGAFKIVCDTEDGKDSAQGRIDEGRGLLFAGLVAGLVGVGFLVSGSRDAGKIEAIERTGRREGYRMTLVPQGRDGVQFMVSRSFSL